MVRGMWMRQTRHTMTVCVWVLFFCLHILFNMGKSLKWENFLCNITVWPAYTKGRFNLGKSLKWEKFMIVYRQNTDFSCSWMAGYCSEGPVFVPQTRHQLCRRGETQSCAPNQPN